MPIKKRKHRAEGERGRPAVTPQQCRAWGAGGRDTRESGPTTAHLPWVREQPAASGYIPDSISASSSRRGDVLIGTTEQRGEGGWLVG